ncbi:MAG: sulfite exporter TauE/SafE family protein [Burkholderiales bacterium]|nr:sulfite exporter TauE/SafE family protein [Burkholderiales bacterium]
MCGGIVAALSAGSGAGRARWSLQLAFNGGRIAVYALAGAVAGAAGSMAMFMNDVLPVQLAMYVLANLMLVGLGLYLFGITRYVAFLERAGAHVWQAIRPVAGRLLPATTWPRAFGLGLMWGWIPCGLVYSMLATALLAGEAASGALVMLAFGLGTLPNLLLAGSLMRLLSASRHGQWARRIAGSAVLGLGLFGIAHAGAVGQAAVSGFLCLPGH